MGRLKRLLYEITFGRRPLREEKETRHACGLASVVCLWVNDTGCVCLGYNKKNSNQPHYALNPPFSIVQVHDLNKLRS